MPNTGMLDHMAFRPTAIERRPRSITFWMQPWPSRMGYETLRTASGRAERALGFSRHLHRGGGEGSGTGPIVASRGARIQHTTLSCTLSTTMLSSSSPIHPPSPPSPPSRAAFHTPQCQQLPLTLPHGEQANLWQLLLSNNRQQKKEHRHPSL